MKLIKSRRADIFPFIWIIRNIWWYPARMISNISDEVGVLPSSFLLEVKSKEVTICCVWPFVFTFHSKQENYFMMEVSASNLLSSFLSVCFVCVLLFLWFSCSARFIYLLAYLGKIYQYLFFHEIKQRSAEYERNSHFLLYTYDKFVWSLWLQLHFARVPDVSSFLILLII